MGLLTELWDDRPAHDERRETSVTALLEAPVAAAPEWTPERYPFYQFVKDAWEHVDSAPFIDSWHVEAVAYHLEATYTGEIQNLLINIPPRTAKSVLVSVLFHPWVWILDPTRRFVFFSYSDDIALRDANKARELIRSEWYQSRWGDRVKLRGGSQGRMGRVSRYENTRGGLRFSSTIGGKGTGEGGHWRIIDDPHNINEDLSDTRLEMQHAWEFVSAVTSTRVANFAEMPREIIVGQRVAEDDVSAHVLLEGTHETLILPEEYEVQEGGKPKPMTCLGWQDPREGEGELLCPALMTPDAAARLKLRLGHRWFPQFQQRVSDTEGRLFPREHWRFFTQWYATEWFEVLIQSWDMAFKDEKTSSFVAGHIWGKKGAHLYLLDRVYGHMNMPATQAALVALSGKWPGVHGKLVEARGNGPAVVQTLRHEVPGLILIEPGKSSKYARAQAVAYLQHAGNIVLPARHLAPWVDEYIEHMARFPALPDDDTDASSQAWSRLMPARPALDQRRLDEQKRSVLHQQRLRAIREQYSQLRLSRTGA